MAMIRRPENFPTTVKELRRQLALSQEELAHALGVRFATVNRLENGKAVPSKLTQRQFEKIFPLPAWFCRFARLIQSEFQTILKTFRTENPFGFRGVADVMIEIWGVSLFSLDHGRCIDKLFPRLRGILK